MKNQQNQTNKMKRRRGKTTSTTEPFLLPRPNPLKKDYKTFSETSTQKTKTPLCKSLSPMASGRLPPMSVQADSCIQISKAAWLDEAKGSNFVFSPFSIYAALSLLASGSKGRTLKQMLSFLNSTSLDHLNSVASRFINLVDRTKKYGRERVKLSFVSGIWVDDSYTLKPPYREIANTIYKAEAEAVDFKTKAYEVREAVNEWVKEETDGLIKALLPDGSINQLTRLVLANALYFKGKWDQEFDSSKTKHSKFYLLDGSSSVQVPFMTSYGMQFISCFDGFKVLQLPYKQKVSSDKRHRSHFSMCIFLPDERDGLDGLIDKVSSDTGFIGRHLPTEKVYVGEFRIPKFKISFGFEASSVLKDLGLVLPFDERREDFSKIVDSGRLHVSSVYHKCFVEVDEVGTEAAAATAIRVGLVAGCRSPSRVDFVADHPFMFIIRDNFTGVPLFIGHVLNPSLRK